MEREGSLMGQPATDGQMRSMVNDWFRVVPCPDVPEGAMLWVDEAGRVLHVFRWDDGAGWINVGAVRLPEGKWTDGRS